MLGHNPRALLNARFDEIDIIRTAKFVQLENLHLWHMKKFAIINSKLITSICKIKNRERNEEPIIINHQVTIKLKLSSL